MKKKLLLIALIIFTASSCSNGRHRRGQAVYGTGVSPGCRIAAALSVDEGNVVGNLLPAEQGIASSVGSTGQRGKVEILSICEDQGPFVGQGISSTASFPSGFSGGGIRGRRTGYVVPLDGLSNNSRIAYSTDGSLLYITQTKRNSMVSIPTYPNGALGIPSRPFVTPSNPTEIATGHHPDPDIGELAVIVTQSGLSVFDAKRIDIRTGATLADALRSQIRLDSSGQLLDIAFSPSGKYVLVTANSLPAGVPNNGVGSKLHVCAVDVMLGRTMSGLEASVENGLGRSCYPGNPQVVADVFADRPVIYEGVGSQVIPGIAKKIAVNNFMAAVLADKIGPYKLTTPNTGDFDPYYEDLLQNGYADRAGFFSASPDFTSRDFRGIAIHPDGNTLLVLEGHKFLTYAVDNAEIFGRFHDQIGANFNGTLDALTADPGPNPEFVLFAESGVSGNKIWPAQYDSVSVRPPVNYIPASGHVVDMAIAPRRN